LFSLLSDEIRRRIEVQPEFICRSGKRFRGYRERLKISFSAPIDKCVRVGCIGAKPAQRAKALGRGAPLTVTKTKFWKQTQLIT
jgi:hypothetical protein